MDHSVLVREGGIHAVDMGATGEVGGGQGEAIRRPLRGAGVESAVLFRVFDSRRREYRLLVRVGAQELTVDLYGAPVHPPDVTVSQSRDEALLHWIPPRRSPSSHQVVL